MPIQSSISRERFYISSVRQENRVGITVMAKEQNHSLALLIANQMKKRDISVDMFVFHRKVNNVTASLLLDNFPVVNSEALDIIAQEIRQIAGEDAVIQLHDPVVKLTILGHGLCTSPRVSTEIFSWIKKAGQNIEMMSISENEINLVFQPSPEFGRILKSYLIKMNKIHKPALNNVFDVN